MVKLLLNLACDKIKVALALLGKLCRSKIDLLRLAELEHILILIFLHKLLDAFEHIKLIVPDLEGKLKLLILQNQAGLQLHIGNDLPDLFLLGFFLGMHDAEHIQHLHTHAVSRVPDRMLLLIIVHRDH